MGTGHDPLSITKTFSGTTADTITLDQLWAYVQITNSDPTNTMWVSQNGTATPTTAVAAAAGTIPVLPLQTRTIQALPIQSGTGVGTIVLSVVGNGGSYTITGVNTTLAGIANLDSRYTLSGAAIPVASGTGRTRISSYTTGTLTLTSTSWADVGGPADLAIAAVAGNIVLISVNGHWGNEATIGFLDVSVVASGNAVSGIAFSATSQGVGSWRGASGAQQPIGGMIPYVVQPADVVAGVVTFRLRGRTNTATNKTMIASANQAMVLAGVNLS